jgi:hypothetical protein
MTTTPPQPTTPSTRDQAIADLMAATVWSTAKLASWALTWVATDGRTPVWTLISGNQDEARAYYATLADDQAYLRWCAAEVLVDSGWTLVIINHRKS